MNENRERLLTILKFEFEFLEFGGYSDAARYKWRPRFIFEDSPTCPKNFDGQSGSNCQTLGRNLFCVLYSLVPGERRCDSTPCRHIVLNDQGDTVDSLYRYGTGEELQSAIAGWLKKIIRRLESELPDHLSIGSEKNTLHKSASASL